MSEKVERKLPADGDPNAREPKQEFGTSFDQLLDGLEVKTVEQPEEPEEPESEERQEPEEQVQEQPEDRPEQSEDEGQDVRQEEGLDLELPSLSEEEPEEEEQEPEQSQPDPVEDEESTRADDEDSKKELEELRKDPHTHARVKKNIDRLLGKIQNLNKQLRQKDQEIEKVKAEKPEAVPTDPVSEEEKRELLMLRRRYSIDKDGTLQEFDKKAKSAEETLMGVVKATLSDEDAETIERVGFEKFANTPRSFKKFLEILDENDPAKGALVRTKYAELVSVNNEKTATTQKLVEEADKWWEEQEQAVAKQQEQSNEYKQQVEKIKSDFFSQTVASDPYFKAIETDGLKGEELARAQTENAKRAIYQRDLKQILDAQSIDDQKKVVYRAALARPLADQVKALQKQLKDARTKLKKIDDARNIRSSANQAPPPPKQEEPQDFASQLERLVGR